MDKLADIIAQSRKLKPPHHRASPIAPATWLQAVGSRIAQRTEPLRLERGVLLVRVVSSVWANELSLLSDSIVEQLRKADIDVQAMRFSVGVIDTPTPRKRPVRQIAPPNANLPHSLKQPVANIGDAKLGKALGDAAAQTLALAEAQEKKR